MDSETVLPRDFYGRDTATVAKEMLGKRLIRRFEGASMEGIIVETEAYYGLKDPASRAFNGRKNYNKIMWEEPGRVFIYNVHKYWMFNVIAHEPGEIGAVLVRAVEPTRGIELMLRKRPVEDSKGLTSGPGKLTIAFGISKDIQGQDVTNPASEVYIVDGEMEHEIGTSRRIGVTRDLDVDLRFFAKRSPYLSR